MDNQWTNHGKTSREWRENTQSDCGRRLAKTGIWARKKETTEVRQNDPGFGSDCCDGTKTQTTYYF